MKRKLLLTGGFLVALVVLGVVTSFTMLSEAKYADHGDVSWRTNVDAAMDRAADEQQPVLLYIWMDNCAGCQNFEERLEQDGAPPVLDQFVLAESQAGTDGLMDRYNVSATPALVVFTPDGEKVTDIVPTRTENLDDRLTTALEQAANGTEEQA
jgi:thiol:disulfide interchange protein